MHLFIMNILESGFLKIKSNRLTSAMMWVACRELSIHNVNKSGQTDN